MRKLFTRLCTLTLLVTFLVGCANTNANFEPKLYDRAIPMYTQVDSIKKEPIPNGKQSTEYIEKEISKIYENLCNFYAIRKEIPEIRQLTEDEFNTYTGGIEMQGCYNSDTKRLYILDTWNSSEKESIFTVTHELLHYLSDNGEKRGFIFYKDGKEFNKYFNEGVTDYLTVKFVGENYFGPYDYQRTLAEQIAIIVGQDKLEEAYFNSDDSEIREIFNQSVSDAYPGTELDGIEFDPFDDFACNCYTLWTLGLIYTDEYIVWQMELFGALEEEVIYCALNNGKEKEVQSVLKRLLRDDMGLGIQFINEFFSYNYLMSIK